MYAKNKNHKINIQINGATQKVKSQEITFDDVVSLGLFNIKCTIVDNDSKVNNNEIRREHVHKSETSATLDER